MLEPGVREMDNRRRLAGSQPWQQALHLREIDECAWSGDLGATVRIRKRGQLQDAVASSLGWSHWGPEVGVQCRGRRAHLPHSGVGVDGTVYFGSDDGKVYAVESSSVGGLAKSPWPKFAEGVASA